MTNEDYSPDLIRWIQGELVKLFIEHVEYEDNVVSHSASILGYIRIRGENWRAHQAFVEHLYYKGKVTS